MGLKNSLRYVAHQLGITNEARFRKLIQEDRRISPSDYVLADKILSAFHAQGGLKQYIQAYKLVSLERLVNMHKPKSILELGTGSSSVVFAKYANKYSAIVTHVDESEKWLRNTQDNIIGEFGEEYSHSEFVLTASEANLDLSPEEFKYEYNIGRAYDMVFVDGPALIRGEKEYKLAICTDISGLLLGDYLPKVIVVDMRNPTVNYFAKILTDYYCYEISDVLNRNPRQGFSYFSVFTLRNS